MVLAERGRGFVQVVASSIADTGMDKLDVGFRFFPVVAELLFAAHGPLGLHQCFLLAFKTVERSEIVAVAQRGKTGNTHVDTDNGGRWMYRRIDLALGLDRDEPLALLAGHGDVFHNAQHFAAVAVAHPAQFWQENSAIALVELAALRIAKAIRLTFFLEARKVCAFLEKVFVGSFQVFQRLLQGLRMGFK